MPKVAIHTLGCKVNQYETQRMAEALRASGYDVVDFADSADVYIINSCSVTHTADSKSRQAVRTVARRHPGACVVLTGCYAETSPNEASEIEGVSLVLGNRHKDAIVEYIGRLLPSKVSKTDMAASVSRTASARTRALVKIQDGCDQFCSYCIVPFARPMMWCKPANEVVDEVTQLADRGFKEIVLTGIRLGRYEYGGTNLVGLLQSLVKVSGIERIRLSSIEMTDVPAGLLEIMASEKKICRHLHVPLQSGNDGVLKRMNRPYTAEEFERFVEEARLRVSDIAITTDIMVGFPGETIEEFEETYCLAERLEFSRAHIFRFSPRQGTAASMMPDDVSPVEKKRRSELLIGLAKAHSEKFAKRFIGKTLAVLVEGNKESKLRSGFTDNYIKVVFKNGPKCEAGEIVLVRIADVKENQVFGEIITSNA
ncbi:MAG: tRNA (N(6)-L-threonylcarbamoyladenosine(37)-C(2))-methylthiotransferase MtaB [Armatimonadetes bacterium]|nr:tRNA (N(6)-L-threonylcarbamoyladenosine(37)-C(2))-methylthiotransferase MtaB [Armatimonadota bacterium]